VIRRILILALLALTLVPAAARADGDPASDVLLAQDGFFPYSTDTPSGTANALLELTKRARQAGWPIKVAIIASAQDLGAVANLANSPQRYANLLAAEIRTSPAKVRLLVVTPAGFGGENLGENVARALAGLSTTNAGGGAGARGATTAGSRPAAPDRHPVATPPIPTGGVNARPYRSGVALQGRSPATAGTPNHTAIPGRKSGGGTPALAIAGPVLLLLVLVGGMTLWQRRRPA
jgi:hypothetical protein